MRSDLFNQEVIGISGGAVLPQLQSDSPGGGLCGSQGEVRVPGDGRHGGVDEGHLGLVWSGGSANLRPEGDGSGGGELSAGLLTVGDEVAPGHLQSVAAPGRQRGQEHSGLQSCQQLWHHGL